MSWVWFWMALIGMPAAMRPMTGTDTGAAVDDVDGGGGEVALPRLPSMTLGWKPARPRRAACRILVFGQLDDLDGARAVRQAADEAALHQRRDQPVDAGLRLQIERVLHLVEGGRHAVSCMRAWMKSSSSFCFSVSIRPPGLPRR